MRVFISQSSGDKPAVEQLALGLRARGIEVWLDKWEIGPGDDIVASINAGLEKVATGIIMFSVHSRVSRWCFYHAVNESMVGFTCQPGSQERISAHGAWCPYRQNGR